MCVRFTAIGTPGFADGFCIRSHCLNKYLQFISIILPPRFRVEFALRGLRGRRRKSFRGIQKRFVARKKQIAKCKIRYQIGFENSANTVLRLFGL